MKRRRARCGARHEIKFALDGLNDWNVLNGLNRDGDSFQSFKQFKTFKP
jgi:hypothetical protein